jgi:hypothetical protein
MATFDDFTPNFLKAKERWPDAPLLTSHYDAIVESYRGSGHDIIATSKSFVECVCRTILGEFGKPEPASDSNTTYLLSQALKALGLANTKGASRLDDILTAHNKMADALSFVRNNYDAGAHGKDGFLDTLNKNECRAYLITADSLVAILLGAYEGHEPDLRFTREPYERFAHLHDRVNRAVSVQASVDSDSGTDTLVVAFSTPSLPDGIELRLEPSELLYALDRTAYLEMLVASSQPTQDEQETVPAVEAIAEAVPAVAIPIPSSPVQIVETYNGQLSALKGALDAQLLTLGGLESALGTANNSFRDSLLATAEQHMGLDWNERLPMRAAMKVAMKRVCLRFGIDPSRAEQNSELLTGWFAANAPVQAEAMPI